MKLAPWIIEKRVPNVVGSIGTASDLQRIHPIILGSCCDLAEIRLDLIAAEKGSITHADWSHLEKFPVLLTARRGEEGGAPGLDAAARMDLLRPALEHASLIDIEVASIAEMTEILREIHDHSLPWIASFHDFEKLPSTAILEENALKAKDAGAAAFKIAAMLTCPEELGRLGEFQLADHGIPVATMGMGVLAPVSRLMAAQCGSVLNYGFVGEKHTAPGQWDSVLLKQVMARLAHFPS